MFTPTSLFYINFSPGFFGLQDLKSDMAIMKTEINNLKENMKMVELVICTSDGIRKTNNEILESLLPPKSNNGGSGHNSKKTPTTDRDSSQKRKFTSFDDDDNPNVILNLSDADHDDCEEKKKGCHTIPFMSFEESLTMAKLKLPSGWTHPIVSKNKRELRAGLVLYRSQYNRVGTLKVWLLISCFVLVLFVFMSNFSVTLA